MGEFIHYVLVDDKENITDGWSNGPHPEKETKDATVLREDGYYHFRLFANGPDNPVLKDEYGICFYRLVNCEPVAKTPEEIEEERKALPDPPASDIEKLKAEMLYMHEMINYLLTKGA